MFKNILLPTDGSQLSERAIQQGIQFAKEAKAGVTGFYAKPEFHVLTYRTEMPDDTRDEYEQDLNAAAAEYLGVIEKCAKEAGVPCSKVSVSHDYPDEAILKAAEQQGCDLIIMASHGRSGVARLLLGSVTQKVLTHGRVPVLVCH